MIDRGIFLEITNIFKLKKDIKNIDERLKILESKKVKTSNFTTNEKVQTSINLSNYNYLDYILDTEDVLLKRKKEKIQEIENYQEKILPIIKNIKTENLFDVLKYRYYYLLEYYEISDLMNYSETQIRRWEKHGLDELINTMKYNETQ